MARFPGTPVPNLATVCPGKLKPIMSITPPNYPDDAQKIGPMASWPASYHQFDAEQILALRAAEATGRPLLVRGEPGTGKSQLAHAAAFVTGRAFLPVVVSGQTEAQDLHWKFDAIARLADAQTSAQHAAPKATAVGKNEGGSKNDTQSNTQYSNDPCPELHLSRYLQPGALWWALNWHSAKAQQERCRHGGAHTPDTPQGWQAQHGAVLLIDEIDKAEPDLPNGLLEALANGAFDVPLLGITVRRAQDCPPPLIIITTNDERELPAAFLRRCLVMTLRLPMDVEDLQRWLMARGKLHFPALPQPALLEAAQLLVADRKQGKEQHGYLPGLAEYLDLLRALTQLGPDALALLPQLKHFYFEKQAGVTGIAGMAGLPGT